MGILMVPQVGQFQLQGGTIIKNASKGEHGEVSSLRNGKVKVANYGKFSDAVTPEDLAVVEKSLDEIYGTESGKKMIDNLSREIH